VPSPNGGDDLVGVLSPTEWARVGIGFYEEAIDGGLESDKGGNDGGLQQPLSYRGEDALHRIDPGRRGRGEVEGPAWVPGQRQHNLWVLVGLNRRDIQSIPTTLPFLKQRK
jgi:hypothetical protein